jgi:hypothetical protein
VTTFPGVARLNDAEISAVVGVGSGKMSLKAGDGPLGEWPIDRISIVDLGAGSFAIGPADATIQFHPDDPGTFAARVLPMLLGPNTKPQEDASLDTIEIHLGPRPRPRTLIGFYLLLAATVAFGVWAYVVMVA